MIGPPLPTRPLRICAVALGVVVGGPRGGRALAGLWRQVRPKCGVEVATSWSDQLVAVALLHRVVDDDETAAHSASGQFNARIDAFSTDANATQAA